MSTSDCTELWRPIAGFPGYEVSNTGKVRSYRIRGPGRQRLRQQSREMIPVQNRKTKYLALTLTDEDGRAKKVGIHRLVAIAFVGVPSPWQVVNHKDRCRTNNQADNLELIDQGANALHGLIQGWIEATVRREIQSLLGRHDEVAIPG